MKTGTLQELNVKPGDVVECVESVRERTVDPHHDLSVFPTYYNTSASMFRIISRASDEPKLWRDMTDEEKGALLLAHHEGRVIQCFSVVSWHDCREVVWDEDCVYRIKPDEPKLWRDMTDEEKGALVLAHQEGKVIEAFIESVWWKVPNQPMWASGLAYRVKPEPVRETVEMYGISRKDTWSFGNNTQFEFDTHRITFDTIDGEPDCDTIKMEEL